jgi:hypothetical protein
VTIPTGTPDRHIDVAENQVQRALFKVRESFGAIASFYYLANIQARRGALSALFRNDFPHHRRIIKQ